MAGVSERSRAGAACGVFREALCSQRTRSARETGSVSGTVVESVTGAHGESSMRTPLPAHVRLVDDRVCESRSRQDL